MTEVQSIISMRNVSKRYGKHGEVKALDDLSLNVLQGEVFGLVGPNGSGKTTTIRILNGIIRPTSGEVLVNGFNIRTHTDDVKRSTGLLAETPGAYEKLSPTNIWNSSGRCTMSRRGCSLSASTGCSTCSTCRKGVTTSSKGSARG